MKQNNQLEKTLQYIKNSLDGNFQQIAAQIAQVDRPVNSKGFKEAGEAKIAISCNLAILDEKIVVCDGKITVTRSAEKIVDDNGKQKEKFATVFTFQDEEFDDQPQLV